MCKRPLLLQSRIATHSRQRITVTVACAPRLPTLRARHPVATAKWGARTVHQVYVEFGVAQNTLYKQ